MGFACLKEDGDVVCGVQRFVVCFEINCSDASCFAIMCVDDHDVLGVGCVEISHR